VVAVQVQTVKAAQAIWRATASSFGAVRPHRLPPTARTYALPVHVVPFLMPYLALQVHIRSEYDLTYLTYLTLPLAELEMTSQHLMFEHS
jgi:hypothetical protein